MEQPELPLDTGLGPEAYFGWRGPDDSNEDDRKPQAHAKDDDRKPPAPDDSDEDCFTITLSWSDNIRISAVELWPDT